ncbi:Ppx/GppA phosphatase family protein [uncultured Bartonella sp.]|uniref:Ppx/GppA phosphatase family protein n=1 Tax=uncultured Bartonella sp. TaxID=104108 RepID=UPI0026319700|nr:Ppx/GppA phosphatase family protein [uncultured Bartonella sp.]
MTPLIETLKGSERGTAGGTDASALHNRLERHKNGDGQSPAVGSYAVPLVKKKRARRRQKGKLAVCDGGQHENDAKKDACESVQDKSPHENAPEKLRHHKKRSRKSHLFTRSKETTVFPDVTKQEKGEKKRKKPTRFPHIDGEHAPLYAALDLGTNNCRLLIAAPTKPGHFHVVDAFSRIVRLGEGLSKSGRLNENAMNRAIEALKICRSKLDQRPIRQCRLIATEACRSAENGQSFIERVAAETGINLEIIDRETEARLAVAGCGTLVEQDTDAIVVFDIGGGSSEIVLIDRSKRRSPRLAEHIIAWTSLPVGVITLAERFGGGNVSTEDFDNMKAFVRELLYDFQGRDKLGALAKSPHFHLLGTSGTVTTLAGIHLKLARYDRRLIDGIWLNNDDVERMTKRLLSWNLAERMANPCIGHDRADLVLAGCAILDVIREEWPSDRLRVADRGLREGILTELMSRDGAWRKCRKSNARFLFRKKRESEHL